MGPSLRIHPGSGHELSLVWGLGALSSREEADSPGKGMKRHQTGRKAEGALVRPAGEDEGTQIPSRRPGWVCGSLRDVGMRGRAGREMRLGELCAQKREMGSQESDRVKFATSVIDLLSKVRDQNKIQAAEDQNPLSSHGKREAVSGTGGQTDRLGDSPAP